MDDEFGSSSLPMDDEDDALKLTLSPPGKRSFSYRGERIPPPRATVPGPEEQHRFDGLRFPSTPAYEQQSASAASSSAFSLVELPASPPPRGFSEQATSLLDLYPQQSALSVKLRPPSPPALSSLQAPSLAELRSLTPASSSQQAKSLGELSPPPPPPAMSQQAQSFAELRRYAPALSQQAPSFAESLRFAPASSQQAPPSAELLPCPSALSSLESELERSTPRRREASVDRPDTKGKDAKGKYPQGRLDVIPPPYPWATDRRAVVHSLDWILRSGITTIQGEVICKRCDGTQKLDIDLEKSFLQLDNYVIGHKDALHDRAPKFWSNPRLLDCTKCEQTDCVKPVINSKKREINWLFLMLTETLGLCTLDQLKYFCKHTHKHRTGAKDRVLYSTYMGLLEQLNAGGHSH